MTRLFDLALDLLCVAGTDGYFKRVNDAYVRVLGYSKEELMAKPFVDFVHPEDVDATLDAIRTLEHGEVVNDFENRFRTKSGEWRWLVWRSTPSDDGRYIYACARDITDEKHTLAVADERGEIVARQSKDLERVGRVHRIMTQAVADGATTVDVLRSVADLTGKPTALFSAAFKVLHCVQPSTGDGVRRADWPIEAAGAQVRRQLASLDGSHPSTVLPPMPAARRQRAAPDRSHRRPRRGHRLPARRRGRLDALRASTPRSSSTARPCSASSSCPAAVSRTPRARPARTSSPTCSRGTVSPSGCSAGRRATASTSTPRTCSCACRGIPTPSIASPARPAAPTSPAASASELGDCTSPPPGSPAPTSSSARLPSRRRTQRDGGGPRRGASALDSSGLRTKSRGALVSGVCTEVAHYAEAHRDLRVVLESMGGAGIGRPVALRRRHGCAAGVHVEWHSRIGRGDSPTSCSHRWSSATRRGAELVVTLRAFLDCNAQYRKTATTLGVHENTVRYRMNQVKQLAAIDPDDLDSLLDVRFALQIIDMTSDHAARSSTEIDSDRRLTIPTTGADPHSWRWTERAFTLAPISRHEHMGVWSWRR